MTLRMKVAKHAMTVITAPQKSRNCHIFNDSGCLVSGVGMISEAFFTAQFRQYRG